MRNLLHINLKGVLIMIITGLLILTLIIVGFIVAIMALIGGTGFLILYGDVIVFALILIWIIKKIFTKKSK